MAVAQPEIEQARALAQQGKSEAAVALLSQLIQRDASNVAAWLALSDVVDDPERAEYCLQKVLTLDPGNAAATEKLSKTKGGSLSVGAVGGLHQDESPSADDPAPAGSSEIRQDADSDDMDRSEPFPAIPKAPADSPEPQGEIPAPEILSEASDVVASKGPQDNEAHLEAAPTAPEFPTEASDAEAVVTEGSQDREAQIEAAPAAAEVPDQEIAERSSVSRTDLILIGLTVLAGIVLCALVSSALIN